jgi:hypothetical protein
MEKGSDQENLKRAPLCGKLHYTTTKQPPCYSELDPKSKVQIDDAESTCAYHLSRGSRVGRPRFRSILQHKFGQERGPFRRGAKDEGYSREASSGPIVIG